MLLLIMLFVSIKFTTPSCRAGKVVFTHPASLPRTATGETPCTKELPLCKLECKGLKIEIVPVWKWVLENNTEGNQKF